MGQCVTISIGNTGATVNPSESTTGGGTNVSSNIGAPEEEEEEEEEGEEENECDCLDGNCFPCI